MCARLAVAVVVLSFPALGAEDAGADKGAPLDKPVTVETGDLVAVQLTMLFSSGVARDRFDAPMLATYDKKAKKLSISVYGSKNDIEGARKSLELLRELLGGLAKSAQVPLYGVQLGDHNSTLIYFGRFLEAGATWRSKELLRREDGKYITP